MAFQGLKPSNLKHLRHDWKSCPLQKLRRNLLKINSRVPKEFLVHATTSPRVVGADTCLDERIRNGAREIRNDLNPRIFSCNSRGRVNAAPSTAPGLALTTRQQLRREAVPPLRGSLSIQTTQRYGFAFPPQHAKPAYVGVAAYGARVFSFSYPDLPVWANSCRAYGAGFGLSPSPSNLIGTAQPRAAVPHEHGRPDSRSHKATA